MEALEEEEAAEPPREYPDVSQFGVSPDEEVETVVSDDEFDDGRRWYVVHCYSGYENKVRHAIEQRTETMGMEDKIFDVIVPTEEEIEIKDGKRRTVDASSPATCSSR